MFSFLQERSNIPRVRGGKAVKIYIKNTEKHEWCVWDKFTFCSNEFYSKIWPWMRCIMLVFIVPTTASTYWSFILFSISLSLHHLRPLTLKPSGNSYFDSSCFKCVHMQNPYPQWTSAILLTKKQVLSLAEVSFLSGVVMFCIAAAERGAMVLCGWGAQWVNWCEFPVGPSGVGVWRPKSAGPAGHRTCSTGLLSFSAPGQRRPPLRGGFSPLPPTDSHWASGIPCL